MSTETLLLLFNFTLNFIETERKKAALVRLHIWQRGHAWNKYNAYFHGKDYSEWFAIRSEGERLGLWQFVPDYKNEK